MSSKKSSPFQGNTAANAMYDYQKKEIQQNFLMSLPFLIVGLVTTVLGVFKFISISKQPIDITDNSRTIGYDASAWIVIAAVGLVVMLIGVINMLKATTAFATLASSLKNVESHISPFQSENLNRKAAVMNQPQTDKTTATDGKKGIFGAKKDKQAPAPQKASNAPQKQNVAPPKAVPIMEQKFDYGLHEEKELSFSEKFMRDNKKDPFESYRKELGIEEEKTEIFVQKPQFTRNTSKAAPKPIVEQQQIAPQQPVQQQTKEKPVTEAVGFTKDEAKRAFVEHPSVKLNKPTDSTPVQKAVPVQKPVSSQQSTTVKHSVPLQKVTAENNSVKAQTSSHSPLVVEKPVAHKPVVTPTNNPYGDTNENDDMFFSFGSSVNKPTAVQTQKSVQKQPVSVHNYEPVDQDNLFLFNENSPTEEATSDDMILNFEEAEREVVAETASQDEFDDDQAYNFSLFEELDPKNKALNQAQQTVRGVPKDIEKANQNRVSSLLDFDSADSSEPPLDSIIHTKASASQSTLSFGNMENGSEEDIDFFAQSFEESDNQQGYISEPSASYADSDYIQTENPAVYSENTENNESQYQFSMFEQSEISDGDLYSQISELSKTASYQQTVSQSAPVNRQPQQNQQYNMSNFASPEPQKGEPRKVASTPPVAKNEVKNKKHGLGGLFSKKNKASEAEQSTPSKKVDRPQEICTNGTKAQRRFVDAAEYDEWKCPQCGNINQEYVGLCSCGARKPRAKR